MTLSLNELIILISIVFLASIVTAITGFGGGIVAMPIFLQFFPLKFINPLYNIVYFINNLILFRPSKIKLNWKLLTGLLIGNIIGALLGAYILKQFNNPIIIKVLALFIITWEIKTLIEILTKKELDKLKLTTKNFTNVIAGGISGIMSAVLGIGGPPLVIYLKNTIKDKELMRSTLIGFFTFNGLIQITAFGINGLLTIDMFKYALITVPFLFLGTWIGSLISNKLPQKYYQIVVSILLIVSGILLLIK